MILVPTTPQSPTVQSSQQSQTPAPKAAVAPTQTPAPKQEISPEVSALMLKATKLERALEQKTKEGIVTRRNLEGTLATERKTWGEKLKDADELRKEAAVNPLAVARKLWGEKAYETLTQAQLNGGAPSAESVTLELDKRTDALKAEFEAKLKERDDAAAKAREEAARADVDARMRGFHGQIAAGVKANTEKLPALLERFGDENAVAAEVARKVQEHFNNTSGDGKDGEVLPWGKVALELETKERELVERIKQRLTPSPSSGLNTAPKVQQPSSSQLQQPSRKTLSNDLTASTQGSRPPPRNDEERRARMLEAYDAARKARET